MSSGVLLRLLPLLALLCCHQPGFAEEEAAESSMQVRFHKTESLADLTAFHFALVKAALEITRPEFGDYVINPYGLAPNAKRQAMLLTEGKLLNLQWASPGTPISQAEVIQIPFDFLQGTLGYRVCLINSHARVNLANINNPEGLREIRVGQGYDWVDAEMYRHNQVPVDLYPGLINLVRALGLNRIDCLALGVNEVQFKYEDLKAEYPFLKIDPSLILYYHFPVYFYVSKKHPLLAERMTLGLQKLQESGAYDVLFNEFYARYLKPLHLHDRKIICLVNPYLRSPNQCASPVEPPQLHNLDIQPSPLKENTTQN